MDGGTAGERDGFAQRSGAIRSSVGADALSAGISWTSVSGSRRRRRRTT
jgi:hypothetical protein